MAMTEQQAALAAALGAKVKALREKRGVSQERLARDMEMSRQTVFDIEHGARLPEWETLERMAAAFGLRLTDLLGDPDMRVMFGGSPPVAA